MKTFFKILFWFYGYIYEEEKGIVELQNGVTYRNIYAHTKWQTKEQGWQDSIFTDKYALPFMDRWRLFKIVINRKKYFHQ